MAAGAADGPGLALPMDRHSGSRRRVDNSSDIPGARDAVAAGVLRAYPRSYLSLRPFLLCIAASLAGALAAAPAHAIALPPSFTTQSFVPGTVFDEPTGIAFLPDGRLLVAEKRGRVWMVTNGVRGATPLWAREEEVLNNNDRGLLDVAVDPHFYQNHYIYLLYTVDPDTNGNDGNDDAFGRLTRYQVGFADSAHVDASTRTILMGATWTTGPCSGSPTHSIGSLRWGSDGTLLVTAGEGAQYTNVDYGGVYDPGMFGAGKTDPYEDIGAYRAQYIGSLAGKLLRLDPATGHGLPSNPYWNGDPNAPRSKVYAYGLRNPFRFTVKPGTGSADPTAGRPGTIYLGDVGWKNWEEVDAITGAGLNFGWPCREGMVVDTEYVNDPSPAHNGCGSVGTADNPQPFHGPILVTSHWDPAGSVPPGVKGNCVVMGSFGAVPTWPATYRGAFVCDFGASTIRVLHPSANDSLGSIDDFATDADGPVDLQIDPRSGDPVYVAINTGQITRIHYSGSVVNNPPVAVANGAPLAGPTPLTVNFSSAGSNDPDNDPLAFGWNFGDGQGATAANPSHTYTAAGSYTVILNVDDGRGGVAYDTVSVLALQPGAFPATSVLDNFNRPDGALGGSWISGSSHLVITSNVMAENTGAVAAAVWPTVFGASQEAYLTVAASSASAVKQGLMLKLQGTDSTADHVEVAYCAQLQQVTLSTWSPVSGFQRFAGPFTQVFHAGDRLGARMYANGHVDAYFNGTLIGSGAVPSWPYAAGGGRIGFVLLKASGARQDDFGGGTFVAAGNTPPHAVIRAPAESTFYGQGDLITLVGAGTDAEDDTTRLDYRWDVLLHHNNHIHPVLEVDSASTSYLGENHDDGSGVWIDNRLIVTDTGLLADTADVAMFPDIDLRPSALTATPTTPGTTAPALYRFTLHNDGRMPSPLVHWILRGDNLLVAQGDTLVAALDSVVVSKWGSPVLTAGNHTLRVVADTAAAFAIVEPDENDNAFTRAITVVTGKGPDQFPPVFVTGPSIQPSGVLAMVRWTNDERTLAKVRFGATPALGDSTTKDSTNTIWPTYGHAVEIDGLQLGHKYYVRAVATDSSVAHNFTVSALDSFVTLTGPLDAGDALPRSLALSQARPNPASDRTSFALALPRAARVRFEVLDVAGRVVWGEPERALGAGNWTLRWPGTSRRGRPVDPGVYLARVHVDDATTFVRRVAVLR